MTHGRRGQNGHGLEEDAHAPVEDVMESLLMENTVNFDPVQHQIGLSPTGRSLIQFPSASPISSPRVISSIVIWKAW